MRGISHRCANDGSTVTRSRCASPAGRGCGCLHTVVELFERLLHAAQQRLSGRIEHDAAAAPLEEFESEARFETLDLLADGAVRQVQHFRRRAQVLRFGDGAKSG